MAERDTIPRSKGKLQRSADGRHALARIEQKNIWVTSRNRELAEHFASLITRDPPVTVEKGGGVIVWGTYAGALEKTGTIVLNRKSDGRFKLVPLDTTPDSLLEEFARIVGRNGSIVPEEGHHGLIFRGVMRGTDERVTAGPAAAGEAGEDGGGARGAAGTESAPTGELEQITGADAIAAIGQKVGLEFLESGVKVRIRGRRPDCEEAARHLIQGSPTVASQQGAKYMIEGNFRKPFLRKGANQQGPDPHGVITREDTLERSFTAFGENLLAVRAACAARCKEGTVYTIVVNDRSTGYVVIGSGRRRTV